MKKIISLTIATAASVLFCIPSANATMYSSRVTWEGDVLSWTDVDLSVNPEFSSVNSVTLPSSGTIITFSSSLTALQVGSGWGTWPAPVTPVTTPEPPTVLYTDGLTSLSATFDAPVWSFGFEMEPNPQSPYGMTLWLSDGTTLMSSLTQVVDGNGGAAFFGWANEAYSVVGFTVTSDADFAIGRLVEGPNGPPPSEVPDSGSLVWLSGALWAGLAGLRQLRCRA